MPIGFTKSDLNPPRLSTMRGVLRTPGTILREVPMAPSPVQTPRQAPFRTGPATLAIEGHLVAGRVLSPDATLGLFVFVVDEPSNAVNPLEEGTPCRIKWATGANFDTEAVLVEAEDGERWVLSVPVDLSPAAMRQSPRLLADGGWGLVTEQGETLDIFDLSARGIGIEFPSGSGPAGVGGRIEGRLQAVGLGSWDVVVECTNVRAHPDDGRQWIVGGRLTLHGEAESAQYQRILSDMS